MDHNKHEHHQQQEMDHGNMDHSKMHHDHGSIPMGMAGHDHHKMMIADFKNGFG